MANSNVHHHHHQQQQQQQQQLHFLLIPLMSQSHIIPLTDFAKLLALRGLNVTIITTPLNAIRYKPIIDRAKNLNLKIQLAALEFPNREVGLPECCENMDSLASLEQGHNFLEANEMMKEPLEKLLQELVPRPSCIVSTNALVWTNEVARKFKIPRYVFHTISSFTIVCTLKISENKMHESLTSDTDSFLVPDMPHEIEFKRSELPEWLREKSDDKKHIMNMIKDTEHLARGVLVNSCEEMEPGYFEEYKKQRSRVWAIGPTSLCNTKNSDKFDRGNKSCIDEYQCLKWLDSMKPCSVIYACFGSLSHIPSPQLIQFGLGLEASNKPFIWIIRKNDHSAETETWLEVNKFEERLKGRGLIIRGWAPQVLILSHPSVGGFFTHCGWNSTVEGVCAGVPMITLPLFGEQIFNETFVVDVLKIGVRIGLMSEQLVKSERVKDAIKELIDGEKAVERRERARELGELVKKAVEEGGSSHSNITMFIQDVMHATNPS
ncbi:UDP-glycosyltransferase 73C5-like [Apium graveolens]|uniref:UDP-glycosyltransferase 73C5-like n=1 Tax=Apium graveolens TaxID=4045 RepID=UPI003D7A0E40